MYHKATDLIPLYGSRTEAHFERGGWATEPYRRRASPRPY